MILAKYVFCSYIYHRQDACSHREGQDALNRTNVDNNVIIFQTYQSIFEGTPSFT